MPVYRFFNPNTGTHFYTASEQERASVSASLPQFVLEGPAYWIPATGGAIDPPVYGSPWQPPLGVEPIQGSFVYLESEPADYIGGGRNQLWTPQNSQFVMSEGGVYYPTLSVNSGLTFSAPLWLTPGGNPSARWVPGYFPRSSRWVFFGQANPEGVGLDFSYAGRGCNQTAGWVQLDQVSYAPDGQLLSFVLRFEQRCDSSSGVLRGKIRWLRNDPIRPPGPTTPIPAPLWSPASSDVPASGSYLYFEGTQMQTSYNPNTGSVITSPIVIKRVMTGARSTTGTLGFTGASPLFSGNYLSSLDAQSARLAITPPWNMTRLAAGFYGNLTFDWVHNPAFGNLTFSYTSNDEPFGTSWSCDYSSGAGWYAIDQISYSGVNISSMAMRFERVCDGGNKTVRGSLRWVAGD